MSFRLVPNSVTLDDLERRKYIFRYFLKNLAVLPCETQKFKMLQLLYQSMVAKVLMTPFNKSLCTRKTYYFIYLFTALSSSACTSHEFTMLRNCWTLGTAFNRVQLTVQLTSGERRLTCQTPAKHILSNAN